MADWIQRSSELEDRSIEILSYAAQKLKGRKYEGEGKNVGLT